MKQVVVQVEDFDTAALIAALETSGAVASFTGLVRSDDGVTALALEHYPGMTEKALNALADAALDRWPLAGVIIVHRVGKLLSGDRIVFVGTASAHRAAALEACAFLIDRLKTDAPFWKKEWLADGSSRWVDARESDDDAAQRWRSKI